MISPQPLIDDLMSLERLEDSQAMVKARVLFVGTLKLAALFGQIHIAEERK